MASGLWWLRITSSSTGESFHLLTSRAPTWAWSKPSSLALGLAELAVLVVDHLHDLVELLGHAQVQHQLADVVHQAGQEGLLGQARQARLATSRRQAKALPMECSHSRRSFRPVLRRLGVVEIAGRAGHHQAADRVEAQHDDGFGQGLDLAAAGVHGAVGDLQDARRSWPGRRRSPAAAGWARGVGIRRQLQDLAGDLGHRRQVPGGHDDALQLLGASPAPLRTGPAAASSVVLMAAPGPAGDTGHGGPAPVRTAGLSSDARLLKTYSTRLVDVFRPDSRSLAGPPATASSRSPRAAAQQQGQRLVAASSRPARLPRGRGGRRRRFAAGRAPAATAGARSARRRRPPPERPACARRRAAAGQRPPASRVMPSGDGRRGRPEDGPCSCGECARSGPVHGLRPPVFRRAGRSGRPAVRRRCSASGGAIPVGRLVRFVAGAAASARAAGAAAAACPGHRPRPRSGGGSASSVCCTRWTFSSSRLSSWSVNGVTVLGLLLGPWPGSWPRCPAGRSSWAGTHRRWSWRPRFRPAAA